MTDKYPAKACLGLPEPDGGLPFVLLATEMEQSLIFVGTTGCMDAIERMDTSKEHGHELFATAQHHHNLIDVPFHVGLSFVEKGLGGFVPDDWASLVEMVDEGVVNAARILDPYRDFPVELDAKVRIETILDEEHGVAFGVDGSVVERVFEDLMSAIQSPILQPAEGRRKRVSKIIDRVADDALDDQSRSRWSNALKATAWITREQQWDAMWKACWHTALAMDQGLKGSQVPFVRVWVERQLALTVQTAMSMVAPGTVGSQVPSTNTKSEDFS